MHDILIKRSLTHAVTEALHAVELTFFLWHMPEGVVEHSFLGCNHQFSWYPMYYPGGMKARVSPVLCPVIGAS